MGSMVQTWWGTGFLISAILLSMGTSVVENLIFLFFESLGASYTLCGFSVLVTVVFEIPIFYFAPRLLDRIGPMMLQNIACITYIVRVIGYTFIPNKQSALVLLFEPLHGVTYACSKTSNVDFAAKTSRKGYEASTQGVLSFLLGIGAVVGLALGGLIEQSFGPALLYRSYALIVAVGLILFYFAVMVSKSKKPQQYEPVQGATELI